MFVSQVVRDPAGRGEPLGSAEKRAIAQPRASGLCKPSQVLRDRAPRCMDLQSLRELLIDLAPLAIWRLARHEEVAPCPSLACSSLTCPPGDLRQLQLPLRSPGRRLLRSGPLHRAGRRRVAWRRDHLAGPYPSWESPSQPSEGAACSDPRAPAPQPEQWRGWLVRSRWAIGCS